MAISTINTTLFSGATAETLTELIEIKDFPTLGGKPDKIETTTLSDEAETSIPGVKSQDDLEFTYNYTKADYTTIKERESTDKFYEVRLSDGSVFAFGGEHRTWVEGAGVNDVVEGKLSITPSTEVALTAGE